MTMLALTVRPSQAGSAELGRVPEPDVSDGEILCETVAVGIDGTDEEIVDGRYGEAPPGQDRLILGHESLGRVLEATADSGFAVGDLVVGFVRRPDPVPCESCAAGEWDMCRNGQFTERGIKGLDGFISERFRIGPGSAVRADHTLGSLAVLTEPTSVVAKAWEQAERVAGRASWTPNRVLVTGAGPLGLLAALLGTQRGYDVHVLDVIEQGRKPTLVADLGATYHSRGLDDAGDDFDLIIECTGVGPLAFHAVQHLAANGVLCLTGISGAGRETSLEVDMLNQVLVLGNRAIVGSVNGNRRHYEAAVRALAAADHGWLGRMITLRVPLDGALVALDRREEDVKTIVEVVT